MRQYAESLHGTHAWKCAVLETVRSTDDAEQQHEHRLAARLLGILFPLGFSSGSDVSYNTDGMRVLMHRSCRRRVPWNRNCTHHGTAAYHRKEACANLRHVDVSTG